MLDKPPKTELKTPQEKEIKLAIKIYIALTNKLQKENQK